MLLLTGATGLVGSRLLGLLRDGPEPVRVLVRDSSRLRGTSDRVQVVEGDLAGSFAEAVRGVDTVVHLAAAVSDQPAGSLEELNGAATWRLAKEARRAGVRHLVLFSAIGASASHPSRFFRSKALAEHAVREAGLRHTILAPSIVYAPGDRWLTVLEALSGLPVMPMPGRGRAAFQPLWAHDAAACALSVVRHPPATGARIEIAGTETLTHREIVALALRSFGRPRRILPIPLPIVKAALTAAAPLGLATWEEAELLEFPMLAGAGADGARSLGVEPVPIEQVLGVAR